MHCIGFSWICSCRVHQWNLIYHRINTETSPLSQSVVSVDIFRRFLFIQVKRTRQNLQGTNHAKLWPWSLCECSRMHYRHHIGQGWFAASSACAVDMRGLSHDLEAIRTCIKAQRLVCLEKKNHKRNNRLFITTKRLSTCLCANGIAAQTITRSGYNPSDGLLFMSITRSLI